MIDATADLLREQLVAAGWTPPDAEPHDAEPTPVEYPVVEVVIVINGIDRRLGLEFATDEDKEQFLKIIQWNPEDFESPRTSEPFRVLY